MKGLVNLIVILLFFTLASCSYNDNEQQMTDNNFNDNADDIIELPFASVLIITLK